ncbi:MAG TPA: hypothetical protein VD884_04320 [Ohtaekwangia sp.]|nr:hypothetical protein [Ohtaekwangia sp.]
MARSKKKQQKKQGIQEQKPTSEVNRATASDQPNDYGGIPDRDLKKNLGCG